MIRFFLRRPVLVALCVIMILLAGVQSVRSLTVELFPPVNFNQIQIETVWPGASPEEVENLVTSKLEDEVSDVEDIDYMTSNSMDSRSSITIFFPEFVHDMEEKLRDVQREVNKVGDLPDDADDPQVWEIDTGVIPVIQFSLAGGAGELDRKLRAEDLQDLLEDIHGVSEVNVRGTREREFRIEYDPGRMRAYGLTPQAVAGIIAARHQNIPAGSIKEGQKEILVRMMGKPDKVQDLADLALLVQPSGPVYLSDVATVKDTFADPDTIARVNGDPCIIIEVNKEAEAGTLSVIQQSKEVVNQFGEAHPDLTLTVVTDNSTQLQARLRELITNGLFGMVVVLIVLTVAIGFRRGIFVAMGIPMSMCISFGLMKLLGYTVNFMTLYGMIVVLGILVDDAIVCVENITRHMEAGISPKKAALKGAREVFWPVLMAVATTMVSFSVLFLMKGDMAPWMAIMAAVVLFMLSASLIDSFCFIPTHIAEFAAAKPHEQENQDGRFLDKVHRQYERMVAPLTRRPFLAMLIPLVLLMLAGAGMRFVPVEMFPPEEPTEIYINFEMPRYVRIEETLEIVKRVEKRVMARNNPDIDAVLGAAGYGMFFDDPFGKYFGQVTLKMVDKTKLQGSGLDLADELREDFSDLPVQELEVRIPEGGPPMGRPVELRVMGDDWDQLEAASAEIQDYLATLPYVINLSDDRSPGNLELRVRVDEDRLRGGSVRFEDFAMAVRGALAGVTATERREGEEEIDIVVRGDPDLTRVSRDAVEDIAVPTTRGVPVPLSTVADITEETGTSVVRRRDREHTITITGDLDEQYAGEIPTPVEMASELAQRFDDIPDNYPGVDLEVGGEAEATQETFGSLNVALQFAVLIIFGLLVIQFNSLGQPFAVLCAIPIGLVGVVAGMLIMGETLSISGMVGVVALAGVAINDSLVFVDFANQARAANPGLSMRDAVIEAGKIRLRPIFLTTLSTIGALLPMAIGLGGKSPMWAPLAITIIFGLLATTPFILFFGPSLLLVIDWLEGAVGNLLKPILPRHDPRDDDL